MLSKRGMMYDWPDPEAEKGTRSYDPMASYEYTAPLPKIGMKRIK
jgi:hypothetical protein